MSVIKTYQNNSGWTTSQAGSRPYAFFRLQNTVYSDYRDMASRPYFVESIDSFTASTSSGDTIASDVTATIYAVETNNSTEINNISDDRIVGTATCNGTTALNITIVNNGVAVNGYMFLMIVFSKQITTKMWPLITWEYNIQITCSEPVYVLMYADIKLPSSPQSQVAGTIYFSDTASNNIKEIFFSNSYLYYINASSSNGSCTLTLSKNNCTMVTFTNPDISDVDRNRSTNGVLSNDWKKLRGLDSIDYNIQFSGTVTYDTGGVEPGLEFVMLYTKARTVSYYDDSDWVPCTVSYYDGTQFIDCEAYYYNGTTWVPISAT